MTKPSREVADLLALMARLRNPENGCPWDLKQSFSTIAPYTLEEAYEVADAAERSDMPALCEELGDLLLQVVFFAQMARENKAFEFADVVESITSKLVRRHPHVFGDAKAASAEDVKQIWDKVKAGEKAASSALLDRVPLALPALTRALKISAKSRRDGLRLERSQTRARENPRGA